MNEEAVKSFTFPLLLMIICMALRLHSGDWFWWKVIHNLAAGFFFLQGVRSIFDGSPAKDLFDNIFKMAMYMIWAAQAPKILEMLVGAVSGFVGLRNVF